MSELIKAIEAHLRQLAPHQKERGTATLLKSSVIELSASQAREAELREKLELWKDAAQDAAKRFLAAEAKIKASQEQEPIANVVAIESSYRRAVSVRDIQHLTIGTKLFTAPVIPPDLADLQRLKDKFFTDYQQVNQLNWELGLKNAELRKLLEESKEPEWKLLTNYGQVKVGDRIMFELCGSTVKRTIGEILFGDTDKEEIIYDRGRNYYIITSMALKGEGNHKNVRHLPKSAQPPKGPTP